MLESPKCVELSNEVIGKNYTNHSSSSYPPEDQELQAYTNAKEEWDAIQCVEPAYQKESNNIPVLDHVESLEKSSLIQFPVGLKITPIIDFDEVWEFFTRQDMSHVMCSIKPFVEKRGLNGLLRGLFGPKRMKEELIRERNLLFAIAQCQLNNHEPIHLQILQTIYKRLMGTKIDCPRYGSHWDAIGFQGTDPATDLRGVGLLGLVHALHLVTHEAAQPLARDIFHLSHDPHCQFPFMVLSINVTRISLQTLREGHLNKECNSRGNVRHVLNEFFTAIMFHVYWIWRTKKKTIKDSGFLIKDAEAYCKANVKTVLHKLHAHLRTYSRS